MNAAVEKVGSWADSFVDYLFVNDPPFRVRDLEWSDWRTFMYNFRHHNEPKAFESPVISQSIETKYVALEIL